MAAFVRAAEQGLKACFKNLSDDQGNISMEILLRDPEFRLMIEEGWAWEMLPWQVEATWPNLPEFAQRALNASNSVANDATEWEVAITIGECFSMMDEPSWQLAEEAAVGGDPACAAYISKIRTLVELYGGGDNFPLIREQEDFYKTLGANKRLGEEFSKAIVDIRLDDFSPRLHVRHALIALNLTSTKVQDGIVKFITKSHISALGAKDAKTGTAKADKELEAARDFLLDLQLKSRISASQFTELLGLFRIRYGSFLTKTGKDTFEQRIFTSDAEIVAQLLADTSAAIKAHDNPGESVEIPMALQYALTYKLDPKKSENKPAAADKAADKVAPLSIAEASSHSHAAKAKGFSVGCIASMKKSEPNRLNGFFKIDVIGSEVELTEVDAFKEGDLHVVKMKFEDLMTKWSVHRGELPIQINGSWTMACHHFSNEVEETRCKLFIELRNLTLHNEDPPLNELVMPCFKPACLRAVRDSSKGEVVIYPVVSSMSQITTKEGSGTSLVASSLKDPASNNKVIFFSSSTAKDRNCCRLEGLRVFVTCAVAIGGD
jgi:hypothetical protein